MWYNTFHVVIIPAQSNLEEGKKFAFHASYDALLKCECSLKCLTLTEFKMSGTNRILKCLTETESPVTEF